MMLRLGWIWGLFAMVTHRHAWMNEWMNERRRWLEERESRRRNTLTPSPTHCGRCGASTCLSPEQAVEEASLGRRVGPVHVQVGAQDTIQLIHVDLFEAFHLNHLPGIPE